MTSIVFSSRVRRLDIVRGRGVVAVSGMGGERAGRRSEEPAQDAAAAVPGP
jgi:hypothetical protein